MFENFNGCIAHFDLNQDHPYMFIDIEWGVQRHIFFSRNYVDLLDLLTDLSKNLRQ